VAGSIDSGPYGTTRASAQPVSGVHSARNIWSVKWLPKPGSAKIASRWSAVFAAVFCSKVAAKGVEVMVVTISLSESEVNGH
jgi:hypothetical protein